jgi:hypothetical protein
VSVGGAGWGVCILSGAPQNPHNSAIRRRSPQKSHRRNLMELNGWASPQMLRRYGASARSARARRTYDRVMSGTLARSGHLARLEDPEEPRNVTHMPK